MANKFFKQSFSNPNCTSVQSRCKSMRTLILFSACLAIFGCSNLPNGTASTLEALETDIKANREILDQQQALLDSLNSTQMESSEAIQTDLLRTRLLLQSYIEQNNQSGIDTKETGGNKKTRAEWLQEEGKVIVGGIENISFTTEEVTYEARIDTGATSSSIDAREITRFERDGDQWVRFQLFLDEEYFSEIERPVVRWVRIFQSGTEEGERRPVVEMAYQFGDIQDTAEFTLTDRSHLEFPALVGRNIMTDRMIVDVSDSHLFRVQ